MIDLCFCDFGDRIDLPISSARPARRRSSVVLRARGRRRRRCRRAAAGARCRRTAAAGSGAAGSGRRGRGPSTDVGFGGRVVGEDGGVVVAGTAVVVPHRATVDGQSARRVADDGLAGFQSEREFAVGLFLSAVDVGADPEVDADGAGVHLLACFAVVHVLEVFLE